ncbi:hypothetical protein GWK47_005052 [Chionoecetes opilio]|uniref:Uncharacterized protein n=1 Tax=Chionoecetes opilio TaxID=41210 RepID=A0A8J5CL67_CHIOP|nr:hypothetical protein GWK47_005052 [Chionoecetes opilio]
MGLHEVVVITPSNTSAFSKAINRLLPHRFRKCDGCNRREKDCTCRFQFFRSNGVAEQHLAGVGESIVTVTRAGDTGVLHLHQHHHNTRAPSPPHRHHHHHQQQQRQRCFPGLSSTLSNISSHPVILSHIIPSHTQLSTSTEPSSTPRGVDHPHWVSSGVHVSSHHPQPHQQLGTGGGVRLPSGDLSPVASSLHYQHHHRQGRLPLTTTTTDTDMPVKGLGSLNTGGNCGGVGGPLSSPPPPPPFLLAPPTTTTITTTTTIFDSNTNNIHDNNHYNNNNQLNLHPFDTTSSTTSSISNTNTSSISASSRCPALHDLHDYGGDGSEGDNYQVAASY